MWEWFISLLRDILALLAGFFGDWGLAIIAITVIIRAALTPLTVSSAKSSARMQILQPKLQEIQERYADDPVRQQEEMQKFYSENNYNLLGGCLPVFLQMPVFFALFAVLKEASGSFLNILPSLSTSAAAAFEKNGIQGAWVYIVFVILFGVLTAVPMLLNQAMSGGAQQNQNKIMGLVMGAMMMWFGWSVPSGVLLYYNASSLWGLVVQQFITRRVVEEAKAEEEARLANQAVRIDVVRKEKKPRPRKKG